MIGFTELRREPYRSVNGRVVEILRVVPVISHCPGCSLSVSHPTARACDRIGCPIKHFAAVHHGTPIIPEGQRDHV